LPFLGLERGPSIPQCPIGMVCRIPPVKGGVSDPETYYETYYIQQIICRGKSPKHAVDSS